MGSRSDWIANRLEGARRRLSVVEEEIAKGDDALLQERTWLQVLIGHLLHEMKGNEND